MLAEVEVEGSDVFAALNRPAACADEADDTVWDDGVKLSCGSAEVEVATSREAPAAPPDDGVCVCCVDCWLSEPTFKLTMPVSAMIPPPRCREARAPCSRRATRELQRANGERGRAKPLDTEASTDGIDPGRKNFRKKSSQRE